MTYRLVTEKMLRRAQMATLTVTAIVGWSIAVTPQRADAKLSVIEQYMSADYWAAGLVVFSVLALLCEIDMARRKHQRWVPIVTVCHIALFSLMCGYAAAAFWGVLFRVWWNFGAPAIAGLLAFWHLMFVGRSRV